MSVSNTDMWAHTTAPRLHKLIKDGTFQILKSSGSYKNTVLLTRDLSVWKAVIKKVPSSNSEYHVIKLTIPKGSLVNLGDDWRGEWEMVNELKLRANQAISHGEGKSHYDENFKYCKDQLIVIKRFSKMSITCATGIHFFLTRREARDYL